MASAMLSGEAAEEQPVMRRKYFMRFYAITDQSGAKLPLRSP